MLLTSMSCNLCLLIMLVFSDTNLDHDDFLKSLMDENGWVPVSKVADFNRVCLVDFSEIGSILFGPCAGK